MPEIMPRQLRQPGVYTFGPIPVPDSTVRFIARIPRCHSGDNSVLVNPLTKAHVRLGFTPDGKEVGAVSLEGGVHIDGATKLEATETTLKSPHYDHEQIVGINRDLYATITISGPPAIFSLTVDFLDT